MTQTCAQRHNEITSKNENIRNNISLGKFLVSSVSSVSNKEFWKDVNENAKDQKGKNRSKTF